MLKTHFGIFFSSLQKIRLLKTSVLMICAFFLVGAKTGNADETYKKNIYIASCTILNSSFEVVRVLNSDWLCLPLKDGGWVSSSGKSLKKFDKRGKLVWEKKGYYHHQIKQMSDQEILVIFAEVKTIKKLKVKFDLIQKINLKTGRVAKEFSFYKEFYLHPRKAETIATKLFSGTGNDKIYFDGAEWEHTHINSIHFYKDRIVINNSVNGAILLSKDLRFTRSIKMPDFVEAQENRVIHDFQILEDGSYLFLKNTYKDKNQETFKIYHWIDQKFILEFPLMAQDFKKSSFSGGVEKMGDSVYLFGFPDEDDKKYQSHVGLISLDGHWIIKKEILLRMQDIKKIPYENFLELNEVM